jgi:hypothetical protein
MGQRAMAGWVLLVAVASANWGLAAEPAATKAAVPDHPTLFRELQSSRKQLLRGEFHGKGHRILSNDPKDVPAGTPATLRGDFNFACQFDYPKNTVMWNREAPSIEIDPEAKKASVRINSYVYSRNETGEQFAEFPGPLARQPDDALQELVDKEMLSPLAKPFDVRTFGLEGEASIMTGTTFDETSASLAKGKIVNVESTADGRCIVVGQPLRTVQVKIWIHPGRGHTAERLEVHVANPAAGGKYERKSLSTCQWEERKSVWVPVSMKGESQFNGPESWEVELKWDRVNE